MDREEFAEIAAEELRLNVQILRRDATLRNVAAEEQSGELLRGERCDDAEEQNAGKKANILVNMLEVEAAEEGEGVDIGLEDVGDKAGEVDVARNVGGAGQNADLLEAIPNRVLKGLAELLAGREEALQQVGVEGAINRVLRDDLKDHGRNVLRLAAVLVIVGEGQEGLHVI